MNKKATDEREALMAAISKWQKEDRENRAAIVLLCERKDEEDEGNTSSGILGPGKLLLDSLCTVIKVQKDFADMCRIALSGNMLSNLFDMLGNKEQ